MTQAEKLLEELLSLPKTFRFSDLVKVMAHFGFAVDNKGRTSGSRIRFYRESDGASFSMHIPHPGSEIKRRAIVAIVEYLRKIGAI